MQAQSPHYSNLSLTAAQDRARFGAGAFFGTQLGRRVGLTAQHTSLDMRDGPTRRLSSLLSSVTLSSNANLVVSAASSRIGNATDNQVFVGVSFFLKANITASASYQRDAGVGTALVDAQKPLPVGTGYGFRVGGSDGGGTRTANGLFQYQGPYGRYEASYVRVGDQAATNVSLSGGFVAIGVTSRKGNLLVPNLIPYYGNILSIADSSLPLDYDIGTTEKLVAPPYRGGAIVTFPVKPIQTVSGSVVLEWNGEDLVPSFGELEVAAGGIRLESPLGEGGEFYLENAEAGPSEATIRFRDIVCSFVLVVPASDQSFLHLPPARCVAGGVKESEP
jgi:outer membrane usher protein